MKVYHVAKAENASDIDTHGFQGPGRYLADAQPGGVWVADRPLLAESGTPIEVAACFEIQVPDRVLLSREWIEDGKGYRKFLVPALVLNRYPRRRLTREQLLALAV